MKSIWHSVKVLLFVLLLFPINILAQSTEIDSLNSVGAEDIKSIRINVLPFEYSGEGDYEFLREGIPSMLVTGLSSSGGFQLIENLNSAAISRKLQESNEKYVDASFYNDSTLLALGKELLANYLIYGAYWSEGDYIRIDMWCVSIESKEIILSQGIDINSIDELSAKVDQASAEIRQKIEFNILELNEDIRNVGVIIVDQDIESRYINRNRRGVQSRRKTLYEQKVNPIYSTFRRKLRSNSKLRVKEGTTIYDFSADKWNIATELRVQYLVSIEFDEYGDDYYLVNIELFDTQTAQLLYRSGESIQYNEKALTNFLNENVASIIHALDVGHENVENDYQALSPPLFFRRWHVGFRQSAIQRPNDGERLFLNDGIGSYNEWFINYRITSRFSVEVQLGRDFGKSIDLIEGNEEEELETEEDEDNAIVSSRQQNFVVHYDFLKIGALNVYAGVGAAFFSVGRGADTESGNEEQVGKGAYGAIFLVGAQISLEKYYITLYLEPRYIYGSTIERALTSSFDFSGGRVGGFYSTLGISVNLPF